MDAKAPSKTSDSETTDSQLGDSKSTESILRRAHAPMEAWELVGNTPLLRLRNITSSGKVEIYAKALSPHPVRAVLFEVV